MEAGSKMSMAERLKMWRAAKETKSSKVSTPSAASSTPMADMISKSPLFTNNSTNSTTSLVNMADYSKENEDVNLMMVRDKKKSLYLPSKDGLEYHSPIITKSPKELKKNGVTSPIIIPNQSMSSCSPISNKSVKLENNIVSESPNREWIQQNINFAPNTHCISPSIFNTTTDEVDGYVTASDNVDGYDDSRSSLSSCRSSIEFATSPAVLRAIKSSNNSIQNGKSRNIRASNRSVSSGTKSPSVTSTYKIAITKAMQDIEALSNKASELENELQQNKSELASSKASEAVARDRLQMATEEINSLNFLNSIQQQKLDELEQYISKDRLDQNENMANKAKKHKQELKKIMQEKQEYEERANIMIQQMTEQMTMLQTMAMGRIDELEKSLLNESRKSEELEQELATLKIKSNMSNVSVMKQNAVNMLNRDDEDDDDDDDEENDGNLTEEASDCDDQE